MTCRTCITPPRDGLTDTNVCTHMHNTDKTPPPRPPARAHQDDDHGHQSEEVGSRARQLSPLPPGECVAPHGFQRQARCDTRVKCKQLEAHLDEKVSSGGLDEAEGVEEAGGTCAAQHHGGHSTSDMSAA